MCCTRKDPGLQDSSRHLTTHNASPAGLSLLKATHTVIQNSVQRPALCGIKGNWERCKKTGQGHGYNTVYSPPTSERPQLDSSERDGGWHSFLTLIQLKFQSLQQYNNKTTILHVSKSKTLNIFIIQLYLLFIAQICFLSPCSTVFFTKLLGVLETVRIITQDYLGTDHERITPFPRGFFHVKD